MIKSCLRRQVMLMVLLGMSGAMMGAFLGYHLLLLRAGMTTAETYKWRDLRLALAERAATELAGCACV